MYDADTASQHLGIIVRDVAPGRSDDELWLAVQVLFDVFQGVLLRRMQQAQPAPDGLTAEVDAVVEMVLTGLAAARP